MSDGGSYSPITMRLNLLASRSMRDRDLARRIRDLVQNRDIETIVTTPLAGTRIARVQRDIDHIVKDWPWDMLHVLRATILTAINQGRQVFYDWERVNQEPSIVIRDNGDAVFITFRSRPEI